MAEIILYATAKDADLIRRWINGESDVAWIIRESRIESAYRWRAVRELESIGEGSYALWHMKAGGLSIPSGSRNIRDRAVLNPFEGWTQVLKNEDTDSPWFGGNLPGPATFTWRELGREQPHSLARSGFNWLGNRYAPIGKPAHPEAMRWWRRLKRFIASAAVRTPWPRGRPNAKLSAFVFPEAEIEIAAGRHADVNP